ncbi:unnamed protein product [Adineta ricciae]|uniref:Vacuolar protein sorting-associated protein 13 n=1 Tax=Adineta ricciae TaxID=249248 RepID=A0A814CKU1_ADIRI|nr:unnamed protein product [Adineta ricciae]CAF1072270.1 unnamed protein product [Adineta ricciae]
MVFENIVGYLLDKYLGDYIENLDTKKLKVDLWSGKVELNNLYLKPNALADLNLPVTISIGYLERLVLEVPWKSIYTSSTKATVDGLFLLVVPKTEVEYDAKRDEKEQHEAKMKEVHLVEQLRKDKEAEKNSDAPATNNDTYMERIQLQIIRNLELSIQNIHIVYEDRSTKPSHPFAVGITLDYIKLHTTTPDWQQAILKEDTPLIHKLGQLNAFSIYWNTDAQSRSTLSRADIIKNLRERIATNNRQVPSDMSYILRPLNVTARVILAMKPRQENFKKPMFDIKVDLDEISLNINRNQYLDVLDLLEFQDYLTIKSKYIKYRGRSMLEQKLSRKNWKFAYEAIVNEEVRPRFDCYKWENIKAHLDRCRAYRKLHIQELTGKLTNEDKQRIQELEKKLDVFNLTYIRRKAEIEARKKKEQEPKTWWGSVSNWWGGNTPKDDPSLSLEEVMTPEEKKKLDDAIGYEGEDKSTSTYPETYIDVDLAIRLKMLDVNVWSKINDNDTQFQIITRATIPDTGLAFRRRPATNAIAVFVDLGSFQVVGMATDGLQTTTSNENRPVLVQPVHRLSSSSEQKLLQIEFETNPLDKSGDYRVKVVAQSMEAKYNAPTINKLAECFEQDTQRNLQGVKQVAYSTYTDVKHRSYILMKHNVEKIKVLDIDIDLQSSYFLLPENGVFQEDGASICMDLGHLTLKRGTVSADSEDELTAIKKAENIDDAREKSYTQFKLKLEDIQLIYANRNESWENARKNKNTPLHLIKPMSLELDVGKCFYNDDAVLPAWKVAGNIPSVDLRLSDTRLFQIMHHVQSIPFPESKTPTITEIPYESETLPMQALVKNPEETLQAVEGMTPVKKTKEKVEAEEQQESSSAVEEEKQFEGQLTQLEAMFTLDKIDIHIDKATSDTNIDEPFLRVTLQSITANTKIKTFDMEFNASLEDLIVYHQQFIGKDNQKLRLLSAQLDKKNAGGDQKLVSLYFLHTSAENPLFSSPTYDGIENRARVHFSKLVVMLQLEALLSIFKFQDSLMKKLPVDVKDDATKPKVEDENKAIEKAEKVVKKNDAPTTPSLTINADLEEFRIILATKQARLFDVQVQGIIAKVAQSSEKTLVNLILSDLRIFDPYKEARYRKIISQQGDEKELLRVDLSLFNHPEGVAKPLDYFDCDVKVQFAKATIVFLFKHIGALLGFLDTLNITKAALDIASTQADAAYEQVQKLQEQAFKVHLDITFNAPNIIIPTNSYSDEALFLDLGKLTLKTSFRDDPIKDLIEEQNIQLENILASRVKLDRDYNILGEAVLLECAELNAVVNRLLFPQKAKSQPGVSINVQWDLVHFRLAKDDYSCVMKVLMENFSENVRDEMQDNTQNENYRYIQDKQEKEEDALKNAVIKKQKELQGDEVIPTMKLRARISKLALTLYLGESDLSTRRGARNDNLKLANVEIDILEAVFRQQSDGSYKATARVKNFLLDDLRETNKPESVTRMMDRHFTVDPNAQMLVATFEFTPKSATQNMARRKLVAQLESLYICISLDYLMTLQDFFISGLPSGNAETKPQAITTTDRVDPDRISVAQDTKSSNAPAKPPTPAAKPATPNADAEVETALDVLVKHPEVILLEDQHNANSNCLVLDLALEMRMNIVNEKSELSGRLRDLTVYSSNFAELKSAANSPSKVKYRILQPAKAEICMLTTTEEQKIDLRVSDIMVSIAPAAVRTVIGVMSSLGTLQATTEAEVEKINSKSIFDPKPFKDANFWFTKGIEEKVEEVDVLETVRGTPSQQGAIKEEENKIKEQEQTPVQKPLVQQLIFVLETLELKLEVGLGVVTKSVVAMCLTGLTANILNWSSNMSLQSTMNIEAALYNEHVLAWEPLIEPLTDASGKTFSPWSLNCSIIPALPFTEKNESSLINEQQRKEGVPSSGAKQLIVVRADQWLNITITKTGLDLVQRLSALFNDVYNKRLPPSDDDDLPLLSVWNKTGRELSIENLTGLLLNDPSTKSITLQPNESAPLTVHNPKQHHGRLSVIEEQSHRNPQEFAVKYRDTQKTVSINRTWKRVYELGSSLIQSWPMQILCDAQVKNDRRCIILSSIVRIFNNTTLPLVLLNVDSVNTKHHTDVARIEVNQDYYVPIDLLYSSSKSSIFFSVDEGQEDKDFFSFDWINEYSTERKLKLKTGKEANFVIFKEISEAHFENIDTIDRPAFNLHIYPALHLTNLLPVDIQCSVDDVESIELKPSQLQLITSGNKKSSLKFTIPSYDNIRWVSVPVDLTQEGRGDYNELPVIFHNADDSSAQRILRMVLRVDAYHESYRLSIYASFWILNRTNLKLEFQIENNRIWIDPLETPFLVCPEKFASEASKKGQIRVCVNEQIESTTNWSEKFSMDVIKSTGVATCKVPNDRTYMICVDIVTSSFGLTKLVTLSPSMIVTNKSSIGIEVVEMVANKEQDTWKKIEPNQLIPFWPRNIKDGVMHVRYTDNNQVMSTAFVTKRKHRTLLRMDDEERPAINVEVNATDFDGVRVIFEDYKIGDAPILVVNCLNSEPVSFSQVGGPPIHTQVLPALSYVYFTWPDPLKERELHISCGSKSTQIGLTPICGSFGKEGHRTVSYAIFVDGVQTVLLFSDNVKVIEAASGIPSLAESMDQRIQIGIQDIGISIVNDITREEMLFISLNKSKTIWTEAKKSRVKPLPEDVNTQLEALYQTHMQKREANPDDRELLVAKYSSEKYREILFDENTAFLISTKNRRKHAKRQALDGLCIEYAWSVSNSALHIRINRVQIDNQLGYTIFPVMFHPVISKAAKSDHAEKAFIELSIFQTKSTQSNVVQFKYFKLLIQEFAVKIDQGLIVAILAFMKQESNAGAPTVNMDADLEQIKKPLDVILKAQIDTPSGETKMYFDNIHLSPLKIHVSFSMHGAKPTDELLAEYPLVGFLLRTLNVAEVNDVILRLGYYERNGSIFTVTKITNDVTGHYQNQFMKQIHVLVLGLDVLGNPFGVIRGLAEGVESFFYEPYKGAIEGPMEFIEGVGEGFRSLLGSTVGGAAEAFSKITGVLGKGLATLAFDEEYKASRVRRKEPGSNIAADIATGGKNVVMGFVDGVTGVVTKPVAGAKADGAAGFFKGLGKGMIGLVTRPTGGIVDFTTTSFDIVKRTAQHEEIVRRIRYPRHVGRDGLIRPYIFHEAMGFYILSRLEDKKYSKSEETYVAHITCSDSPQSWLIATSKRLIFATEMSLLDSYEIDWDIEYEQLYERPTIKPDVRHIEILTKNEKKTGTTRSQRSFGKLVKYKHTADAQYIVKKISDTMHSAGN